MTDSMIQPCIKNQAQTSVRSPPIRIMTVVKVRKRPGAMRPTSNDARTNADMLKIARAAPGVRHNGKNKTDGCRKGHQVRDKLFPDAVGGLGSGHGYLMNCSPFCRHKDIPGD